MITISGDMTTITIEPGREVQCDYCGADWTDREETGGILFGSKAVCPDCVREARSTIARYNEEAYIRGECPAGMSFADWVRNVLRK